MYISFEGALRPPGVSQRYTTYFDTVVPVDLTTQLVATNDLAPVGEHLLEVTGDDPYLVIAVPEFEGATNQVVFVTIADVDSVETDASSVGQLFWRGAGDSYSENSSTLFDVVRNGGERVYRVSPSFAKPDAWIGSPLTEIRIDLPTGWTGGTFEFVGV